MQWKRPKIFCCAEGEGAVDHSKVTRCLKKFCSGCKNQTGWDRSETVNFKAMLQAIEVNL